MKIRYILQPESTTFGEFAEKNDLTMQVVEREHWQIRTGRPRYYAEFVSAEVKIGNCLHGFYGEGDTAEEAIKDYYTGHIEGHNLIINATNPKTRREIRVPTGLKLEWKSE